MSEAFFMCRPAHLDEWMGLPIRARWPEAMVSALDDDEATPSAREEAPDGE